MTNQELISFIKQSIEKGIAKEKISSDLLANGWNESDIAEGFVAVSTLEKQPSVAPPVSNVVPNLANPQNSLNNDNVSKNKEPDFPSNVYHPIYQEDKKPKNIWNFIFLALLLVLAYSLYSYRDLIFRYSKNNDQNTTEDDRSDIPTFEEVFSEKETEEEIMENNVGQEITENIEPPQTESISLPYQVNFESPTDSIKVAGGEKLSLKIKTGEKIKSVKINFFVSYVSGKNELKEFDVLTKDGYSEYTYTVPASPFKSIDVIAEGVSNNKVEQSQAESKLSEKELHERFLTLLPLI